MNKLFVVGGMIALVAAVGCVNPPGVGLFFPRSVDVEDWNHPAIDAEAGQNGIDEGWQYREVDGPICANGTPVGMGVEVGESPFDLVIYVNGGGACWDAMGCSYFQTAANLSTTYDAAQLGRELYPLTRAGLFDRQARTNPWPQASYVFIPYCTGDMHVGRRITNYGGFSSRDEIHHVGAFNLERYLEEIPELFPRARRIWLVGISAGGYGITWNFDAFQQAFPDKELHVLTDAAPWLPVEEERRQAWAASWDLVAPVGCEKCVTAPEDLPTFLAQKYPRTRFALTLFAKDPVLSAYLGVLPSGMEASIDRHVADRYTQPNIRVFLAQGADHEVLLHLDRELRSRDGERLSEFVRHWATGW